MDFRACRRAGVPLVAIETAEPAACVNNLVRQLNGKADVVPVVVWDIIQGAVGRNEPGRAWVDGLCSGQDARIVTGNPVEFLGLVSGLPDGGCVVMLGADGVLSEPAMKFPAGQAVWNLRDLLKVGGSSLVLVGGLGWKLPAMLVNDVVTLTDNLPDDAALLGIVGEVAEAAGVVVADDDKGRAVDALAGLSSFAAEQSIALSISKSGLDLGGLWERKRRAIEQTPGLSVWRGGETFADLAGYDSAKALLGRLFKGADRPRVVVWIDEVEKHLAGNAGDLSGTSQEMMAAFCSWFPNSGAEGLLLYGVAGSGKSTISKAAGAECGVPTVAMDFSGLKGSLVGESGSRLRAALASVDAMGRGRVLVLSTCNGVAVLAPEIRRRLGSLGTFFFDLPTKGERAGIWSVWKAKAGRPADEPLPSDDGWTGAEIAQCCTVARKLGVSLVEAAGWVVPVSRSAADVIEGQRRQASGKFLNASAPGVYRYESKEQAAAGGGRRVIGKG